VAAGPGVSDKPDSKTEHTEQQAPGKRPTPAPHDKRSECIQDQAWFLENTAEKREADTLSQHGENVTGHR